MCIDVCVCVVSVCTCWEMLCLCGVRGHVCAVCVVCECARAHV